MATTYRFFYFWPCFCTCISLRERRQLLSIDWWKISPLAAHISYCTCSAEKHREILQYEPRYYISPANAHWFWCLLPRLVMSNEPLPHVAQLLLWKRNQGWKYLSCFLGFILLCYETYQIKGSQSRERLKDTRQCVCKKKQESPEVERERRRKKQGEQIKVVCE